MGHLSESFHFSLQAGSYVSVKVDSLKNVEICSSQALIICSTSSPEDGSLIINWSTTSIFSVPPPPCCPLLFLFLHDTHRSSFSVLIITLLQSLHSLRPLKQQLSQLYRLNRNLKKKRKTCIRYLQIFRIISQLIEYKKII